jgi:hypothetical protein
MPIIAYEMFYSEVYTQLADAITLTAIYSWTQQINMCVHISKSLCQEILELTGQDIFDQED